MVAVARLGRPCDTLFAGARAAVQLVAVSRAIGWVVRVLPLLLCFLLLMDAVAVRTAGRRVVPAPGRAWLWAAVTIAGAVLPVVAVLLTGVVARQGIALVPLTGILIGGALTATVPADAVPSTSSPPAGARWRLVSRSGRPTGRHGWRWHARPHPTRCSRAWTRPAPSASSPFRAPPSACSSAALTPHAGAVQLFVLVALLPVHAVATAVTLELVTRGHLSRAEPQPPEAAGPARALPSRPVPHAAACRRAASILVGSSVRTTARARPGEAAQSGSRRRDGEVAMPTHTIRCCSREHLIGPRRV